MASKDQPYRPGTVKTILFPLVGLVFGLVLCHFWPDSDECKLVSQFLASEKIRCQDSIDPSSSRKERMGLVDYTCIVSSSTI